VRVPVWHRRHLDELGAHHPQRVLLLLRLGFGDHDHGAEAERVADHRQPDPGIAGGSLDDDAAGPETAVLECVPDDVPGRAILDRLAGIHELALAEDGAAGFLRRTLQPDERGVADRLYHCLPMGHNVAASMPGGTGTI